MKKQQFFRSVLGCLLLIVLLFSLTGCQKELPPDAEDPSDALIQYVRDFWDSDIYNDAIYDAFWKSDKASIELQNFNRLNALNAKLKILTMSDFTAETVSIDGTKAVVKLSIHGINFGEYAEAYLDEFDKLQGSVAIVGDTMLGLTAEEVSFALQMMPISVASDERVTFRDFEQEFELKYKDDGWEISKPAHKDGKVFLELFGEHITKVLDGQYKFRPGYDG